MKLRIRGNSLRLRLSRTDLSRFESEGLVEEEIALGIGPDQRLVYALSKRDGDDWSARISGTKLIVGVPAETADKWAASEETGISTVQDLGDGKTLQILIERDFTCLKPREGEDHRDTFEHPNAAASC